MGTTIEITLIILIPGVVFSCLDIEGVSAKMCLGVGVTSGGMRLFGIIQQETVPWGLWVLYTFKVINAFLF